eukprot:CAMPEP_0117834570 /NCGR_PEP_ID=MMETSP0949-20121206/10989_1 /TAXON_ID=44440 /ORGANISM="Chattonella subsalsa, Strain CCMP2191" /LENGTH=167 /DNA_ID=CAMNT_0005676435 /DNA_START=159 /DNA_END=662 /DNA_ORIENTATION=+
MSQLDIQSFFLLQDPKKQNFDGTSTICVQSKRGKTQEGDCSKENFGKQETANGFSSLDRDFQSSLESDSTNETDISDAWDQREAKHLKSTKFALSKYHHSSGGKAGQGWRVVNKKKVYVVPRKGGKIIAQGKEAFKLHYAEKMKMKKQKTKDKRTTKDLSSSFFEKH